MTGDTCNSTKVFQIILHLTVSMLGMVKCCSSGQQEELRLIDLSYWASISCDAGLHQVCFDKAQVTWKQRWMLSLVPAAAFLAA